MNRSHFLKKVVAGFLLLFTYWGIIPDCQAQANNGMLIFQIDGNSYVRKNFSKNGKLLDYQTIEVGKTRTSNEKIETKMTVVSYDADGTLEDASQTTLRCTPESRQVLMGIFPFAGAKTSKNLIVKMEEGAIMYPVNWRELSVLKDFNFSLDFKDGAAGFLGTKSDISITNRKVSQSDKLFKVAGRISIKAYVFGIKVSTLNYRFYERIGEEGIVYQKFTAEDGSYFTINIKR